MTEILTNKQIDKIDPSRTTVLRNIFAAQMRKRLTELALVVKRSVYDNDCFGLKPKIHSLQMSPAPKEVFALPRSAEKIDAFMIWLEKQIEAGIINVTVANQIGVGIEEPWTNLYISDSYKRGILRARYEMRKAGMKIPSIEETGGIGASFSSPFHIDRVGIIFSKVYSELKGITAAMDMQISKILAQGIMDGDGPALLARKLVATINGTGMGELGITDKLGRFIPASRRAEMLARTEIISSFAEASLQEYLNWGVVGVGAQVEFCSAHDEKVCSKCESLDGQVFSLEDASGIISVHPNCRCIWLPVIN